MRDRNGVDTAREKDGSDSTRAAVRGRPPQGLLALQATVGNTAVVQLLRAAGHPVTQPRAQRSAIHDVLRLSDPGGRFEREADDHAPPARDDRPAPRAAHPPAERAGRPPRPGAAVQRVVYGQEAEQRAQREQLENLAVMWVPVEEFDEDGNPAQRPTVAYTSQRTGHGVDALRVERKFFPPSMTATRSGNPLQDNWVIEYQTSFFVYKVQAINARTQQQNIRTLIDPDRPFQVIDMIPKGSQGRSMGRTYRFGDYWEINPDFPDLPGDRDEAMTALIKGRGLEEDNRVRDEERGSLVPLPSTPYQPFRFYTRAHIDPHFTHQDGSRKDDRRFLLPADFDRTAAQAPTGRTRGQVGLSRPPVAGRQDAGRDPAKAMADFSAHSLMPSSGHGATPNRLASHEWCHLIGDNDGGPTVFHNLVVGTNAVNTEQLAMESALRDFRRRMDGLGYAIRLRVKALVEKTEALAPGIPGGLHHKADWISFTVDIVEARSPEAVNERSAVSSVVHRQIMDANRGTITESEFTSLHNQVRNLLRAEHARLKEQKQYAEHARQGSPMSVG